jgi:hypothetical protein
MRRHVALARVLLLHPTTTPARRLAQTWSERPMTPAKKSLATIALLTAIALAAQPQTAHAQCDPALFSDNATDPNFFWSDVKCSADKSLGDMAGIVIPELVVTGWKEMLNYEVKGLGDVVGGVLEKVIHAQDEPEAFGPSNADLMRAVQAGTNYVITQVNRDFRQNDVAQVDSVQQAYLLYQSDPKFYSRVGKSEAEWGANKDWFYALDLLSLERHGPLALHASLSLASVLARRFMDLELAYKVKYATPPSHMPPNSRWEDYLASATEEDLDFWAQAASEQALRDVKAIFNGGALSPGGSGTGVPVSGLFSHLEPLANGGLRTYSDSRFSQVDVTDTIQDACGGEIGVPKTHKGHYHFPINPTEPGDIEKVPQYDFSTSWNPCAGIGDQKTVPWTLKVTDRKGKVIFTSTYQVAVLDADLGIVDQTFAMEEPERILKQAAYEKLLTMAYGAVRPTLDDWWQITGNPGFSGYTADKEINALVLKSEAVSDAIQQIKNSAPDWSAGASPLADERRLVNYALTYGAGGLDELYSAAQADRIAWNAGTTRAADYRKFLAIHTDPGAAKRYFQGLMAAKFVAIAH